MISRDHLSSSADLICSVRLCFRAVAGLLGSAEGPGSPMDLMVIGVYKGNWNDG